MLSRCLVTKFLHLELSRKFIGIALLVGVLLFDERYSGTSTFGGTKFLLPGEFQEWVHRRGELVLDQHCYCTAAAHISRFYCTTGSLRKDFQ